MAVIRDIMPAFDLLQPTSAADAQNLLAQHGRDAWVLAGGLDSFDWLKDRIKKPKVVVDLSGIAELKGIKSTADGGVEIGAMTTLTEVVRHPVVREKFGILSDAIVTYMEGNKLNGGDGVKVAYCPMKQKPWMQKGDAIANPYYGDKSDMATCGSFR